MEGESETATDELFELSHHHSSSAVNFLTAKSSVENDEAPKSLPGLNGEASGSDKEAIVLKLLQGFIHPRVLSRNDFFVEGADPALFLAKVILL